MDFDSLTFLVGWNWALASVAAVVVWTAQRIGFVQQRPGLRHLLWLAVLIGFLLPCVPVPILSSTSVTGRKSDAKTIVTTDVVVPTEVDAKASFAPPTVAQIIASNPVRTHSSAEPTEESAGTSNIIWLLGISLLIAWAAISVAMVSVSIRMFVRHRRAIRLLPIDPDLDYLCGELAPLFRIRPASRPRALVVEGVDTPSLFGGMSPAVIILPKSIVSEASVAEMKQIISHELAHYSRLDHWSNLLGILATCVLWWNPFVWLARRNLSETAEVCCDALVIDRLSYSRKDYARVLWKVVEAAQSKPDHIPMTVSMSNGNRFISRRFEMISNKKVCATTKGSQRVLAGSLLVMLTLFPVQAQDGDSNATPIGMTTTEAGPWVGRWSVANLKSRVTDEKSGLASEAGIVFGFDPGASQQRGKVLWMQDEVWCDFVYRIESDQQESDKRDVIIVLDFNPDNVNGTADSLTGRFRLLDTGRATFTFDETVARHEKLDLVLNKNNSLPISFAPDYPLAPQGTAGRPWIGFWQASVSVPPGPRAVPEISQGPARTEKGFMAFAYDPSKSSQKGYLRFDSEREWQAFGYLVERPSFDGLRYRVIFDFCPEDWSQDSVDGTLRFNPGHTAMTVELERNNWTNGIRKMELVSGTSHIVADAPSSLRDFIERRAVLPQSMVVYPNVPPGEKGMPTVIPVAPSNPNFYDPEFPPITAVQPGASTPTAVPTYPNPYPQVASPPVTAVPPGASTPIKVPSLPELQVPSGPGASPTNGVRVTPPDGSIKRMHVFVQSLREIRAGDFLLLNAAPVRDPNVLFQKVASPIRVKVLIAHGQTGADADVTFAYLKPAGDRLDGGYVHAEVEHGIVHDERTREGGDTSEIAGRWRLESVERGDGFTEAISGEIEAEVTGDLWKVYVDGVYQSSKLVSVDATQSPSHITLIHRHRGTGEPTIHRGLYRIVGNELHAFYSFDQSKRPKLEGHSASQRLALFIRQRWVRVESVGNHSKD